MKAQKHQGRKSTKEVTVLFVYRFLHIARICFTVLSSNGTDRYNTCFDGDASHASCNCPSKVECYHIRDLRPRAAAYFAARKAEAEMAKVEAFIAAAQATKAAGLPAPYTEPATIINGVVYVSAQEAASVASYDVQLEANRVAYDAEAVVLDSFYEQRGQEISEAQRRLEEERVRYAYYEMSLGII